MIDFTKINKNQVALIARPDILQHSTFNNTVHGGSRRRDSLFEGPQPLPAVASMLANPRMSVGGEAASASEDGKDAASGHQVPPSHQLTSAAAAELQHRSAHLHKNINTQQRRPAVLHIFSYKKRYLLGIT